ncbi:Nitrogenase iron protein [Ensifer psoraleae]|uniref:hypothetical protein n=1 Tax=Sinorhizobium psoraleae TaxID=520838 RepID=UPI00156A65DC|nr:Nitrogenase iron protein [Sinorhizobium psoraleae]
MAGLRQIAFCCMGGIGTCTATQNTLAALFDLGPKIHIGGVDLRVGSSSVILNSKAQDTSGSAVGGRSPAIQHPLEAPILSPPPTGLRSKGAPAGGFPGYDDVPRRLRGARFSRPDLARIHENTARL